jgi:hypothetical protein
MQTIDHDFSAFLSKLKANPGAIERRNDSGLSQIGEAIDGIATAFEQHKAKSAETIGELRSTVAIVLPEKRRASITPVHDATANGVRQHLAVQTNAIGER